MSLAKIRVPRFLREAFLDTALIIVIKAGRRTGKTYNWVIWIITMLDQEPNKAGLWVDTKHANIDKYVERYFRPILTKMNHWEDCNWNAQKKILTLHNGSYIDFGSAERPENMEGFEYDYAVLNEGGLIFKKQSLWENTLYPMLKHAQVRIIGTPKGKNTFETLYRRYKHYTFNCYDSPFWTEEQIKNAKETMTEEAFRQEMLADFIEGAGAVFRRIRDNVAGALIDSPEAGKRYVLGADLAKHQDFTVIFVADAESRQIVYHERFNQIDWGLQKSRIINAYNKFGCASGVIDATGVGDAIFDDLRAEGLNLEGFKFTSTTKQELVSNLSVAMDNGNISYPDIPELINELEIFAYEQRANGNFIYSAPEGFHDDEVMALGLVNRAIGAREVEYGGVAFL
ncbi:hypothetical protein MPC38_06745 [Prescottella equi]|uniref:phage terminase large subunit family protein n=1 Tax=Rhodococcus hoagii TaxID=43767 RepID=UPI001F5BDA82|nr:terminase family protein [Prescottella equi]UNQ40943.1 hypothetical protein MPC38_06745 [Prescottella equi]